jgi:hypothetical protein
VFSDDDGLIAVQRAVSNVDHGDVRERERLRRGCILGD